MIIYHSSITLTELDPDGFWGYTVKATLENKSADVTYMFSVTSASVNGVETDPVFATEVTPGNTANADISFIDSDLSKYDIGDISDICISFRVYDTNDWAADAVSEQTIHIYPLGEDEATTFHREPQADDYVIVDNDDVYVAVIGYDPEDFWGYAATLYIENRSDNNVMFAVDNAAINGIMMDPLWAYEVHAGNVGFSNITWFSSGLEENNIDTVNTIRLDMRAYNADDLMSGDYFNETVDLTP